MNAPIFNVI
jgi:hypothetical protein